MVKEVRDNKFLFGALATFFLLGLFFFLLFGVARAQAGQAPDRHYVSEIRMVSLTVPNTDSLDLLIPESGVHGGGLATGSKSSQKIILAQPDLKIGQDELQIEVLGLTTDELLSEIRVSGDPLVPNLLTGLKEVQLGRLSLIS